MFHIISPCLFGGIVRKATQHVKSNQGRGREDNYCLEIPSSFFVESKTQRRRLDQGMTKVKVVTTKRAIAQTSH